jgi:hypothetical protein
MEPRDNVHVVERFRALTWEQATDWLRAHNYVSDGKIDWPKIMREAEVGGTKDVLKQRWNEGGARFQRQRVIERLEELEKKKATDVGARLAMLDEWIQIGEAMAEEPEELRQLIEKHKPRADQLREIGKKRRELSALERDAFGSTTPKPRKPRR